MPIQFKKNQFLIFIFSEDMSKLVVNCHLGKHDALLYQEDLECKDAPEVYLATKIFNETELKIQPSSLRRVVSLQNIEKKWKMDVMMTLTKLPDKFNDEKLQIVSSYDLPYTCHPQMSWLVPLSIDLCVYGSVFNQILMK